MEVDPNWLTRDQADALHEAALALNGLQVTLSASSGAKYAMQMQLYSAAARLQRALSLIHHVCDQRAAERKHEWRTDAPRIDDVIVTRGGEVRAIDSDAVARVAREYAAENPRGNAGRYATEGEVAEWEATNDD